MDRPVGKARLRHLAVTIKGNKKAQLSLTSACLFFLACCSLADNFNPVTPSDFSLILPFPYVPSFLSLCYTAHQPYPILGHNLFTAQHLDSRPRLELLALANPGLGNEKAQHRQTSTLSNKSSSSPPCLVAVDLDPLPQSCVALCFCSSFSTWQLSASSYTRSGHYYRSS